MTARVDIPTAPAVARPGSIGYFVRHYFEMLIAMIIGMIVFGALFSLIFALLGHGNLLHYAALRALLMATYMTVGMSLWMRHRGHDWLRISEMGAAMYIPFFVLLAPFWLGAISRAGLLGGGHLLMLPSMLAVMLYRFPHYSQGHNNHAATALAVHSKHSS